LKIVHIIQSLESGGAEQALSKLVNHDLNNEHIIVLLFESKVHYDLNENVNIINFNFKNTFKDRIKILRKLKIIIRKSNPDIVHTWMNSNFFAPILKRTFNQTKFIISIRHGLNKKYSILDKPIINKYFTKLDGTIFVSNSSKKEFSATTIQFPNKKVIQNGFEKEKYLYAYNPMHQVFNFAYIGRKSKVKNQDMLIKAFDEFSKDKMNVKLLIAGKNMEEKYFEENISDINKLKFKWFEEQKYPFEIYRKTDALILTSESEGFPNVIGEAMSIGVPVITTNAGESFEIIGNTGFKIEKNVESLVEMLESIYHSPKVLLEKSKQAYKKVHKDYSIEKIVNEYNEYYKKVLKG